MALKAPVQGNESQGILPLLDNQTLLTSDSDKANCFNTQFQNFFVKDNHIVQNFHTKNTPEMPEFSITVQDITNAISEMKDKFTRTHEEIPSYFIKRTSSAISFPLLLIFEASLQYNIIPSAWKQAIVVPVFKKGNRNLATNYRPISLTSSICRLFESIVSKKILSHLLANNLLSSQQFGLIPTRSSCCQLLSSLHQWALSYSNNQTTYIIYTDIRKAFDSVSHTKLIHTFRQYKIYPSLINWLENFLTNRLQQVVINTSLSLPVHAYSGVPQGSILAPLEFILYFNDAPEITIALEGSGNIMLFTDDAKVFSTVPDKLQESLQSFYIWLKSRQLQLAPEKCFLLQITKDHITQPSYNFQINNNIISSEPFAKDLGIFITQNLKWDKHVDHIFQIGSVTSYQIRINMYGKCEQRYVW